MISSCEKLPPIELPKATAEYDMWTWYPIETMWENNVTYYFQGIYDMMGADYIDSIYINSHESDTWARYSTADINYLRAQCLEPMFTQSPKLRGRGDLGFNPGTAAKEDSLWFVQNGWTINQKQR